MTAAVVTAAVVTEADGAAGATSVVADTARGARHGAVGSPCRERGRRRDAGAFPGVRAQSAPPLRQTGLVHGIMVNSAAVPDGDAGAHQRQS